MKITLLIFSIVVLSAIGNASGVAHAQSTPAPTSDTGNSSATIPMDQWEYQALYAIQKDGVAIPQGSPAGRIPMTRREFAEVTARFLQVINPSLNSNPDLATQQKALKSEIEENKQALEALLSLTDEFAPELKEMNTDVASAKARLDALEQRLAVVEAEKQRMKRDGINFDGGNILSAAMDTEQLDKNGYQIARAGSHTSGDSHSVKLRLHKKTVHFRHHRRRRKIYQFDPDPKGV